MELVQERPFDKSTRRTRKGPDLVLILMSLHMDVSVLKNDLDKTIFVVRRILCFLVTIWHAVLRRSSSRALGKLRRE